MTRRAIPWSSGSLPESGRDGLRNAVRPGGGRHEQLAGDALGVDIGTSHFALPGGVQEIALGAVMILILMFRPSGIMGNRDLSLPGKAGPDQEGQDGPKT